MTATPSFRPNYSHGPGPPYTEDAFTEANATCLRPEFWHSDDDESAEHEVTALVAAFVVALQPEIVVELGTAFGQTAEKIGRALQANGHGVCISIDNVQKRVNEARERCAGLPVEFACCDAATFEPPTLIDFAWVDSGPNRADEIRALSHWFRPHAIIGVHDTGPQHAVRAHLEEVGGFRSIYLPTPRGVGFLEKL